MENIDRNDFEISENGDSIVKDIDEQSETMPTETHSHHHSHHSHHGHHRHHSSSGSRHKKRNTKQIEDFKNFLKHNKKNITHLVIALALLTCLVLVGVLLDKQFTFSDDAAGNESNAGVTQLSKELQISVPFFEKEVVIVGPAVEAFVNAEVTVPVSDIYDKYRTLSDRLDVGLPVELSYKMGTIPGGYSVKSAEFLVADNREFNNPTVYNTDGSKTKVDVYHLKTGTQYYYQINLTFSNGTETSVGGSFKTAAGPRVLTVDGVYNLRDVGGWKTVNGQVIKQGLLYRGCEIDGAVEPHYKITPDGINTMLAVLGIKTELDLRDPADNKYGTDALGAGVKHMYYPSQMYAAIFNSEETAQVIRQIFSQFADKNNYPIYLHCTYGVDRTGTICYLLEGLLGVEEESIMKDYQLSGLHHGDVSSQQMDEFVQAVKNLPGYTLPNKIEGWLLSIGVTEEEIDSIREIFIG